MLEILFAYTHTHTYIYIYMYIFFPSVNTIVVALFQYHQHLLLVSTEFVDNVSKR